MSCCGGGAERILIALTLLIAIGSVSALAEPGATQPQSTVDLSYINSIRADSIIVAGPDRELPNVVKAFKDRLVAAGVAWDAPQYQAKLKFLVGVVPDEYGDCTHNVSLSIVVPASESTEMELARFSRSGWRPCDEIDPILAGDYVLLLERFILARKLRSSLKYLSDPPDVVPFAASAQARSLRADASAAEQVERNAADSRNRDAAARSLGDAAYAVGCAIGGGNCNAGSHTNTAAGRAASSDCTSDFQCGLGQVCVKPAGSFRVAGRCAAPVDKFGVRDFGVQKSGWGAREVRSCQSPVDCPVGFRCSKDAYQLTGICARN